MPEACLLKSRREETGRTEMPMEGRGWLVASLGEGVCGEGGRPEMEALSQAGLLVGAVGRWRWGREGEAAPSPPSRGRRERAGLRSGFPPAPYPSG